MVAHHASPGTRTSRASVASRRRCCTDASAADCRAPMQHVPRPALAARRQPADDLAGAVRARASTAAAPVYRRERWDTPDGDFIDVDFADAAATAADAPLLVLFHGLEGSSAQPLRAGLRALGARRTAGRFAVPHFRGCSGELNRGAARLPLGRLRGDRLDPASACARAAPRPLVRGRRLARRQRAAALGRGGRRHAPRPRRARWPRCRSPIDLAAGGHAIGRGFNRQVYTPHVPAHA